MCVLRSNIVTNCKRCKSSVRPHCTIKRKTTVKTFTDNNPSSKKSRG